MIMKPVNVLRTIVVLLGVAWPVAAAEPLYLDRVQFSGHVPPPDDPATTLWYRQPAKAWIEAMPIGNGRQAAMVFGGVARERLQLNEDTIWSGSPHDYDHPDAFRHLAEIRKLIDEQKFAEAVSLGDNHAGLPARQASYQPLGDLLLECDRHGRVAGLPAGARPGEVPRAGLLPHRRRPVSREIFASWPDQVIVVRLACDRPRRLAFGRDSSHTRTRPP